MKTLSINLMISYQSCSIFEGKKNLSKNDSVNSSHEERKYFGISPNHVVASTVNEK